MDSSSDCPSTSSPASPCKSQDSALVTVSSTQAQASPRWLPYTNLCDCGDGGSQCAVRVSGISHTDTTHTSPVSFFSIVVAFFTFPSLLSFVSAFWGISIAGIIVIV